MLFTLLNLKCIQVIPNTNTVDGVVLAKSLPQSSKEKELKFLIDNAKSAMKNKEVTVITITTH